MKLIDQITALDKRFFLWLKRHKPSKFIESLLRFYTRIGDGYIWGIVLLYLFTNYPLNELAPILEQAVVTTLISLAIYWVVKLSIRRPRPFNAYGDIEAQVPPLDKFSFPSGHTMNNMAIGLSLAYHIPSLTVLVLLIPFSWGILRVYYGVHFISDIVGGMLLASLAAFLGNLIGPLHLFPG